MQIGSPLADVNELRRATGLTAQAIQAMAKREAWPFEATPAVAGRVKHWYPIAALPERLGWLVGYFRRKPAALRREGQAAYDYLLSRRALIVKTDASITGLTAAGLSQ